MENRDLAHALSLHEWIKVTLLDFRKNESLTEVVTVLIEVDDASILIDKHSNEATNSPVVPLGLHVWVHRVVIFPSSVSELVASCEIDSVEIDGSG